MQLPLTKKTQRHFAGLWCSRISSLNMSKQFGRMGQSSGAPKTFLTQEAFLKTLKEAITLTSTEKAKLF